jgi:hypothetical protein
MVAVAPAALFAHHGPLLYDPNPKNMVKVEGRLTEVNWGYPHISAKLKSQGKIWKVVFPPAAGMAARGITRELLASSKTVIITGQPRRDGKPELRVTAQVIDGKKY